MKKVVLIMSLFLLCRGVHSQSFTVGVIAGFSSTDVEGLNVEIMDKYKDYWRLGVVAGVFVNRSLNERSSVQMELLYATKGSLSPADSTNNFTSYRLVLDYIEIPILFKYKMHLFVNKEALDKLELEVGPSFAVLVNSWQENTFGTIPFDPSSISNKPFNTDDFLFNLGLNYYFSNDFSLDVRFGNSVVPIREHPGDVIGIFSGGDFNSTFSYTFRYTFR